jgi:hypothetical protein
MAARPSLPGRRHQRSSNRVVSSRAAGDFRPVVYEGGPAPPVAHALRPRSAQLAPRPFATVAYVPGEAAMLEPAVRPPSCVHASPGDLACVLVVHHMRERKAGPQIPVTVAQCRTHRRAFTLYPLGHVPYGRLTVTLDGQVVVATRSEPAAGARRSPTWRATRLGAAFTAIDGPTVKLTDRRWWATQTPERLGRSATLLGIYRGCQCPTPRRSRSGSTSRGWCSERRPMRTRTHAAGPAGAAGWSVRWTNSARTRARSDPRGWRVRRLLGYGDTLGSGEPGHARSGLPVRGAPAG